LSPHLDSTPARTQNKITPVIQRNKNLVNIALFTQTLKKVLQKKEETIFTLARKTLKKHILSLD
ncbi:hypothetical protein, partial [Blautia wexlerae]|uniref:hypothetical protein n=1 Tax=Blautia wexlerae TaxID=418240 RepID=UPI00232B1A79